MIKLVTLGSCAILRDGEPLSDLAAHKQKYAILVYLAVEGPVSRDQLLGIFWPEREEERARHSLSQALYALKRETGVDCVVTVGNQVDLDRARVGSDVEALQEAADREHWPRVIELYDGSFLNGFVLPRASAFEDWSARVRARVGRLARRGFSERVERLAEGDELDGALRIASRWASLEPLEDEAQHALIALLARAGHRNEALEQYETYRRRLSEELQVEPLEETTALVQRIRSGEQVRYGSLGEGVASATPIVAEAPDAYGEVDEYAVADQAASISHGQADSAGRLRQLLAHRVFHLAVAYLAVSWLTLDIGQTLIQRELIPPWSLAPILAGLVLALPLVFLPYLIQRKRGEAGQPPSRLSGDVMLAFLGSALIALLVSQGLLKWVVPDVRLARDARFDPSSLAVLPFEDLSPGGRLGYLADGFSRALIDELTRVEALDVISWPGVLQFRGASAPPDSIARVLQVGSMVAGTLESAGDLLRINVQLIDPVTQQNEAARTIEGARWNNLALRDTLVEQVSRWLRERLGSRIRLTRRREGTESDEAWRLVKAAEALRGDYRAAPGDDGPESTRILDRADSLLARAMELDPSWTDPAILRGWIASERGTVDSYLEGLRYANRSLEIDSRDARGLELRGTLRRRLTSESSDSLVAARYLSGAEDDLRAAVRSDPRLANAWATLSLLLGEDRWRLASANQAAERAYEEDHFLVAQSEILSRLCWNYLQLKVYDEAMHWCAEGRRRNPNSITFVGLQLGILVSEGGPEPDPDLAWRLVNAVDSLASPSDHDLFVPLARVQAAGVLVRAGQTDSARSVLQRELEAADENLLAWLSYDVAHVMLMLGDRDEAIAQLRIFLNDVPGYRATVARDHWFEDLRGDSRFDALVDYNREPIFCQILCKPPG